MSLAKATRFLSLLGTHPSEFVDGAVDRVDVALQRYRPRSPSPRVALPEVLGGVGAALGTDVEGYLSDAALSEVEREVRDGLVALDRRPFPASYNADSTLARLCYALVRATRPRTVLETGVAYGITSAFIAAALEANGEGTLHSVDRPPVEPGAERYVGILLPPRLRHRRELHRGSSKRVLPGLVDRLGQVDLFVHDSLHTYRNIRRELSTVTPRLAPGAAVVADDATNLAFSDWAAEAAPAYWSNVADSGGAVAVLSVSGETGAPPRSR